MRGRRGQIQSIYEDYFSLLLDNTFFVSRILMTVAILRLNLSICYTLLFDAFRHLTLYM